MSINKDINLIDKYNRLKLDKYILSNLRYLKNEKNYYLKNNYSDIFTDINTTDFYNALHSYKNDGRQLFLIILKMMMILLVLMKYVPKEIKIIKYL